MENYIVRIYRRTKKIPKNIAGIVENPDSGENIPFHNNEEFIEIFVPPYLITEATNRKQVVEHRKYRRFNIKNSILIFDITTDIGEIADISLGGLSFYSPNMPDVINGKFSVGILCEGVENFCTGKINCSQLLLRSSGQNTEYLKNKYSVVFDALTPNQKVQLKHVIKHYAVTEA